MSTYSLYDLNEHVRRVVALNFQSPVWITAEIAESNLSGGHLYLTLIQKSGDEVEAPIVAQAQAMVWNRDRRRIFMAHGAAAESALSAGAQSRILVRLDFHERYGLKLHIEDVDPAYTLGVLALQRRQTITYLRSAGLLEQNAALPLPAVLQRLAVITSEDAAGFQDFRDQTTVNNYGYTFHFSYFFSTVQGKNAEKDLISALEAVAARHSEFDAVVLVRGGGSRLDLSAFDSRELGIAIANMPLPVITGIGHETDESVADIVAHTALKTPTAVAVFLLEHNLHFEARLLETGQQITRQAARQWQQTSEQLSWTNQMIGQQARFLWNQSHRQTEQAALETPDRVRNFLRQQATQLEHTAALIHSLSPATTLRRGYSLTLKNGKTVYSAAELSAGDEIDTVLGDGVVRSVVE